MRDVASRRSSATPRRSSRAVAAAAMEAETAAAKSSEKRRLRRPSPTGKAHRQPPKENDEEEEELLSPLPPAVFEPSPSDTDGDEGDRDGRRSARATEAATATCDAMGRGLPTDRLQFGYCPAHVEEAIAFHAHTTAAQWRAQRSANFRAAVLQGKKLEPKNCEPLSSVLKLKQHWRSVAALHRAQGSTFGALAAAGGGRLAGLDETEDFLEALAARQQEPRGEGLVPANASTADRDDGDGGGDGELPAKKARQ